MINYSLILQMSQKRNKIDEKTLQKFVTSYLNFRPAFYALIRPQEAYLLNQNTQLFQAPILDFGCGDGFFASQVFGDNYIDVGLDLDNSRILQAKKIKTHQKLVTFDGKKVPFGSNTFSTIFSNSVLEHIPDISTNLNEIYRVLKPGGLFICSVMADKWEQFLPLGRLLGQTYINLLRKKQEHYNLFSHQKWRNIFEHHGFKIISNTGYLNKKTVNYFELCHYLSVPSLISYKISGCWTPIPNWHKPIRLSQKITSIINNDINSSLDECASLFFIMKRTS